MNINSPIKLSKQQLSHDKIHIIILIIGVLLIIQMFSGAVGYILNEIDNSDFSFTSKLIALDVYFQYGLFAQKFQNKNPFRPEPLCGSHHRPNANDPWWVWDWCSFTK